MAVRDRKQERVECGNSSSPHPSKQRRQTAVQRTTIPLLLVTLLACRESGGDVQAAPVQAEPIPASVSAQRRTPVVEAVHAVMPAVVNIRTEATIRRRSMDPWGYFFGVPRDYTTQSVGSGFVWGSEGIIVTNNHVVEGASRIRVAFSDGRELDANVLGVDPDSDLAVLRVDERNLPAASIGSSADLLIGEPVIAVGNPFGLSGSVTTGVVSAIGRSVPSEERGRTFTDFIQTDASINPGNSGGPLLNIEGRVIGINVAIYANAQGIGFAIPVDRARKIIDDLLRFGEVQLAWVGVSTATVTPEEALRLDVEANRGAMVMRLFADSPAARAGLRTGDVIVAVNGRPVDSREAFNTQLATAQAGRSLQLRVVRDDETVEVSLTPSEVPADLGLVILREVGGIEVADARGAVAVSRVLGGSYADQIGLTRGDLIVAANGVEVRSSAELNAAIRAGADRSSMVILVQRGRYIYTVTIPMFQRRAAGAAL